MEAILTQTITGSQQLSPHQVCSLFLPNLHPGVGSEGWTLIHKKGVLILYYFQIGSAYVAQAGLELVTK